MRPIQKSFPILCKGMAEHFRDKNFQLPEPVERPFNKYGNGEGASGRSSTNIFRLAPSLPKRPITTNHDVLRQQAINCDLAEICGKARPITTFNDNTCAR